MTKGKKIRVQLITINEQDAIKRVIKHGEQVS